MSDNHLTFFDMSDDLLTFDNAQSHVTAFRPISAAARSWSDDNIIFVTVIITINNKNCSLSIVLTATDQKPQKS